MIDRPWETFSQTAVTVALLAALAIAGYLLIGCSPAQVQEARDACDVVVAEIDHVKDAARAQQEVLDALSEAHALCIECGRALDEADPVDAIATQGCVTDCIEAVGDAAQSMVELWGYVEKVGGE